MDQLIQSFGIDGKLIVAQIINFIILVVALSYFLYRPMLNMLRTRQEKIDQGIKDAEAAAAARSIADTEKKAILTAAEEKAGAVYAEATKSAAARSEDIVAEAKEKAEAVARAADEAAESMKAKAIKESEAEIAKAAMLAAETILRQKSS